MMKSRRTDTEKKNLVEEGERMGINEIIRQNNLNPQV